MIFVRFRDLLDLAHVFTENVNILSIHLYKWSDGLVVSQHIPGSNPGKYFIISNSLMNAFV